MIRVLIAGIGHPDRGDDAVGLVVAEQLDVRLREVEDVEVVATTADPSALLTLPAWDLAEHLIVVDACVGGAPTGHVHVFQDPDALPVPVAGGTHDLGLATTLALARALGRRPAEVTVLAVEGAQFEVGAPLSPEVLAAAERLVARLAAEHGA